VTLGHELYDAEHALLTAAQQHDLAALASSLTEDFVITTAGWIAEPVGKQAWLDSALTEHNLESFDLRVAHTRRYGDTAVVLVESVQSGTRQGERWSLILRYTDVWTLGPGGWRLGVRHASAATPNR
jgi:ketosteroid isomerase-like protein